MEVVASLLRDRGVIRETIGARDATDEELLRVHTPHYLELVKREIGALHAPRYLSTGDVVVDSRSLDVARRAAGGAIAAIEAAAHSGEPVFALVRPPGHHAESARGMGFCLFNNAAIAARAFQAQYGGSVMVVDFDYHHGNGTQAVAGSGLSYVSTHAYPAYPGTGTENEERADGAVINVPLPASGVETEAFVASWEFLMRDVVARLRPSAIVASAGFDYVAGDPVGDLGVDVSAATHVAAAINRCAWETCGGRLAYVLEGGYDVDALARSIAMIADATDSRIAPNSNASLKSLDKSTRYQLDSATSVINRLLS